MSPALWFQPHCAVRSGRHYQFITGVQVRIVRNEARVVCMTASETQGVKMWIAGTNCYLPLQALTPSKRQEHTQIELRLNHAASMRAHTPVGHCIQAPCCARLTPRITCGEPNRAK